jgi:hypothetical protein
MTETQINKIRILALEEARQNLKYATWSISSTLEMERIIDNLKAKSLPSEYKNERLDVAP